MPIIFPRVKVKAKVRICSIWANSLKLQEWDMSIINLNESFISVISPKELLSRIFVMLFEEVTFNISDTSQRRNVP
jgi:hypothetical protein